MEIDLTPELERFVQAKVESGEYASSSAVICQALQLVAREDERFEARLERLRAEIQLGIDDLENGLHSPADEVFEALRAELRKRAV